MKPLRHWRRSTSAVQVLQIRDGHLRGELGGTTLIGIGAGTGLAAMAIGAMTRAVTVLGVRGALN